ncbi:dihydroneopterin aldolase [Moraxella nasovis]|uniref:dihydroneopterin aldolase n=1 Tax=Moraxella nasovis TaxID=2904121 RepID=UPI001F6180C2|nr:dihydroneopterin aldolase [Moraxella nasovis]UNU73147.1 dihydroneopterin aldolase [Moraxella nasovis]
MNDVVFIQGLKVQTVIGVYDWERAIKQLLMIDAKLTCDMTQAAQTDDVAYAIDYQAVCADIEQICHDTKAKLLEYLADQICDVLLQSYPCDSITLTIHKPNAITAADSVGVQITRQKPHA